MNLPLLAIAIAPFVEHSLVKDWAWGLALIIVNVMLHISGLMFIGLRLESAQQRVAARDTPATAFILLVGSTVFAVTLLHGIEAELWAFAYSFVGALPDHSTAILYSLGAITGYGHAPIFLQDPWKVMGALEAFNGVLMFGLTTAFLFFVLQKGFELRRLRQTANLRLTIKS
jgi:hypothetical protein